MRFFEVSDWVKLLFWDGSGVAHEVLAKGGAVRLTYCLSHVRRVFYELAASSPIAKEALARLAELYRIETEIRCRSAGDRRSALQARSRPVIDALEPWLPS